MTTSTQEQQQTLPRGQQIALWAQAIWKQVKRDARTFLGSPLAVVGLILIVVFALMGLAHPLLLGSVWPRGIYDPQTGFDTAYLPWPAPPAPGHPLGLDSQGRDILSMLLAATGPTFAVAISAALTTAVLSLLIGAVTAYFGGGLIDRLLSNISDALLLLPAPLAMAIIGARYYADINSVEFGMLYGLLTGASGAAIVMRGYALRLMQMPFIEAARVSGAGPLHIMMRHLIPHMLPLAAVHMMLAVVGAVVADGFFAFFGFRAAVRLNWGTMIYNALIFRSINPNMPWVALAAPTICLSLFAASFYFIARGMHRISDPRLR